jgi:hypothetical protein
MTHQIAHRAGQRDAITGDLDAIARVTVEQGQTAYSRRKIAVVTTGGLTASLADDAQTEKVTLTIGAPTEVRAIRVFATVQGGATSTTATTTDFTIIVNPTAVAGTVTLPAAAGNMGRCYVVKHANAAQNSVTIDPNGAELIDGNATLLLTARQAAYIQCDGTAWHVLSRA